jgi:16S rRNA (uracil1498-N3)-methyltransferase
MNCYFCASIPDPSGLITLDEPESRHAATARRQKTGDRVLLIDGQGRRAQVVIVSMAHAAVEVRVEFVSRIHRQRPEIILACAIAKGDRQKVLLDMATQLGIDEYVPLHCERSVARPAAHHAGRWSRVCVEACKQSHNPFLPKISPVVSPESFAIRMRHDNVALFVADTGGHSMGPATQPVTVAICIGPEGGFSDIEKTQLVEGGARLVSLGRNILRIETAATAAVSSFRG